MIHIPPKQYIDRDSCAKALSTVFSDTEHGDPHFINGIITAVDFILDYPTEKVEEVRHGKPIVYEVHGRYVTGAAVDETGTPFLMRKEYVEKRERCPFCNATLFGEWGYYCDKCGAKMDKEKEE